MDKYQKLSEAALHLNGLVVLSVFVDAQDDYNECQVVKEPHALKASGIYGIYLMDLIRSY